MIINRRKFLLTSASATALPGLGFAAGVRDITWDDLIPPGVPYGEIVGEGVMDMERDLWRPIYDQNAAKVNKKLNGVVVKIPGYIVPIDVSTKGVTSFILVPYVGACVHTPPPPPNQLIFVSSETPWSQKNMWDPVWVTGKLGLETTQTDVAVAGYVLQADQIETYVW